MVDRRVRQGIVEYKVRWAGWNAREASWEEVSSLAGAQGKVIDFLERNQESMGSLWQAKEAALSGRQDHSEAVSPGHQSPVVEESPPRTDSQELPRGRKPPRKKQVSERAKAAKAAQARDATNARKQGPQPQARAASVDRPPQAPGTGKRARVSALGGTCANEQVLHVSRRRRAPPSPSPGNGVPGTPMFPGDVVMGKMGIDAHGRPVQFAQWQRGKVVSLGDGTVLIAYFNLEEDEPQEQMCPRAYVKLVTKR